MSNISDYLDWRGDISMEADPFNVVDSMILSELAYTEFDDIVPAPKSPKRSVSIQEACEQFFSRYTEEEIMVRSSSTKVAPFLMYKMINSRRFEKIRLMNYVSELDETQQTQFAVVSFLLEDGTVYVAYRGTDNTIVGWKEDFNMSFLYQTEGQIRAARYLDDCYGNTEHRLRVGGHSKGGNFAVYASGFCCQKVQERIEAVYSNDGPGFLPQITSQPSYQRILPKVVSVIPEFSIVGMLLENEVPHQVVKSSQNGAMQHDLMSWEVLGNRLVLAENVSTSSIMLDRTLKNWVYGLDTQERETFVNILFGTLQSTGATTLDELTANKFAMMGGISKSLALLDSEQQNLLKDVIRRFASSSGEVFADNVQEKLAKAPFTEKILNGPKSLEHKKR